MRLRLNRRAPLQTGPTQLDDETRPTVVPFKMTLMGKTHELSGQVSDWSYSEKAVSSTVSFPVSLKDCGIKPPNVLGLVKVKDEILVKASLALKRK